MRKTITLLALCLSSLLSYAQGKITLTTKKELNSAYWSVDIKANEADKSNVWIDWNNNGTKDENESDIDFSYGNSAEITSQTITIYGNISLLKVANMDLTAIHIEAAPQLQTLDLRSNKLTALDLTQATQLKKVQINKNTSLATLTLPLGGLQQLEEFSAIGCDLSQLDLSACSALRTLELIENKRITSLDVSNCTALESLDVSKCALALLKMGSHPSLADLNCSENKLTDLDLSHAPSLVELWCYNNSLTELKIPTTATLVTIKTYNNQLSGATMRGLIASLAQTSNTEATLYGINLETGAPEYNVIWKKDVATAQAKGWKVLARKNRFQDIPYEGTEESATPDTPYKTTLPQIQLTRSSSGEPWSLRITGRNGAEDPLWADLNNNGKYDMGEELASSAIKTTIQSQNTQLTLYGLIEELDCTDNHLTAISIGEESILASLLCAHNELQSLDLTRAKHLSKLQCQGNRITQSNAEALIKTLTYRQDEERKGEIVAMDFATSNEGNQFLSTEVSQALARGWEIYCIRKDGSKVAYNGHNPDDALVSYTTESPAITLTKKESSKTPWQFKVTPKETLKKGIWLDTNKDGVCQEEEQITSFDDIVKVDVSSRQVVLYGDYEALLCSGNELTAIDLSSHPQLTQLYCDKNEIATLTLPTNTSLETLSCVENKLSRLDLSQCSKLKKLLLSYNPINSILWPQENNIADLTFANGTGFMTTTWDLSAFKELKELKCNGNGITKLTLPENDKLLELACYNNKLTAIDLSRATRLSGLVCDQNRLTTLDLSNNQSLEYVSLYSNHFSNEELGQIVEQLPSLTNASTHGELYVIDSEDYGEENLCRSAVVQGAKAKKWKVYDNMGRRNNGRNVYDGYIDVEDTFSGEVWDGTATTWVKGSGTIDNPYLIEKPQHLAYLAKTVTEGKDYSGIYFQQTADLNMGASQLGKVKGNFRPIGIFDAGYVTSQDGGEQTYQDDSKRFNGVYDGSNHFIMNLYQYYNNNEAKTVGGHGLFGCVGAKGEVRNLYLTKSCLFEGDFEGASLVSYLEGNMTNCGSLATVRGASILGGLVAVLSGGEISKSFFAGLASGTMNVGGLAGYVGSPEEGEDKGKTPIITDSYVNANIQSASSYIGAAIGFVAEKPVLKNIYATGAITGDALRFMKGAFIGALDGKVANSKDNLKISHCYYDKSRITIGKATSDGEVKGIEAVSEEELRGDKILQDLGSSFAKDEQWINRGYPIIPKAAISGIEEITNDLSSELNYSLNGLLLSVEKESSDLVEVFTPLGQLVIRSYSSTVRLPERAIYLVRVPGRGVAILSLQ